MIPSNFLILLRVGGTENPFLLHIMQTEKGKVTLKRQMLRRKVILSTGEKLAC